MTILIGDRIVYADPKCPEDNDAGVVLDLESPEPHDGAWIAWDSGTEGPCDLADGNVRKEFA